MAARSSNGQDFGCCRLRGPGWNEPTRRALKRLIDRGSGKKLPVVFDFDNTLVCGDIGEATLAVLVREGVIDARKLSPTLSPAFRLPKGRKISPQSGPDLTEYYEALLAPTVHGDGDATPLANGYVWAVEILEGLELGDVINATAKAANAAATTADGFIEVTPGGSRFRAPYFYPEMIELVAELIRHRFEVWIVSASNVWSVRWMVQHRLNPLLREQGVRKGLPPERVVGISTLLMDRQGYLYKDGTLVGTNAAYANLDPRALRQYRLTSRLQFPVPTYSGKVACIFDAIGGRPYLCAGDSPGDHAMLAYSHNRLWIKRPGKADFQRRLNHLQRKTGQAGWLVQAVGSGARPGFAAK